MAKGYGYSYTDRNNYATFKAQEAGRDKDMLFDVTYKLSGGTVMGKVKDVPLADPVPHRTYFKGDDYLVVVTYRMELNDDQD